MTQVAEIPLTPEPQTFSIMLGSTVYELTFTYRNGWLLDIADASSNPILSGIPLVCGLDLLAQYQYLGIGGALVVLSDGDGLTPPTFDNLGQSCHLYFVQ